MKPTSSEKCKNYVLRSGETSYCSVHQKYVPKEEHEPKIIEDLEGSPVFYGKLARKPLTLVEG